MFTQSKSASAAPSRLSAAPSKPQTPHQRETVDEKKLESDGEFTLLGIRSSEVTDLISSPSYTIDQRRALACAASNGALQRVFSKDRTSYSYRLRIVTAGAVTPTAGVASSSFLVDPSVIPLSEWTTWATLFDEVRVRGFSVTVAPYSNGTTSSGTNSRLTSLAMGSFYSKTSTPSNIVQVLMADDATLVSPLMVKPHRHRMRVPRLLGFAPTSSPAGTTFYGCPGSVQLYATGDGTNSMLTYFVCGIYELRGRL